MQQLVLSCCIKIGTKLCECCHLKILGEFQVQGAINLFHCLDLGCTADRAHGQANVHGWPGTLHLSLEEILPIADTDHIGWDVCTNITSLGLNDG